MWFSNSLSDNWFRLGWSWTAEGGGERRFTLTDSEQDGQKADGLLTEAGYQMT